MQLSSAKNYLKWSDLPSNHLYPFSSASLPLGNNLFYPVEASVQPMRSSSQYDSYSAKKKKLLNTSTGGQSKEAVSGWVGVCMDIISA